MKFLKLIFATAISSTIGDACNEPCVKINGLCDSRKGSWCNERGACQNLFISGFQFCYVNEPGHCLGDSSVKCSAVVNHMAQYRINSDPNYLQNKINSNAEFYAAMERLRRENVGSFKDAPSLNIHFAHPNF